MLHPSYSDLMKVVNAGSEDDTPVVNSRYSIVMATAKRARQIIGGGTSVTEAEKAKPLSTAVRELDEGSLRIISAEKENEEDMKIALLDTMQVPVVAGAVGSDEDEDMEDEEASDENADANDEDM